MRQLLPSNTAFHFTYRNGLRATEAYAVDFEVDLQFLCFEDDPTFEPAVGKAVDRRGKIRRQYLANFFGPKRDTGDPIHLIYFAIPTNDSKKMNAEGGVDSIYAAVRSVPAQVGIDPTQQVPHNNFQQLPRYDNEPLAGDSIDACFGLGIMQEIQCAAPGLAKPYLEQIQETPEDEDALILATVKCVAHIDSVEASEQVAPVGVLDCSTVLALHAAGRVLLAETMGSRAPDDTWARRQFKHRSYQQSDGLESPRDALIAALATLIGAQRLVVGWPLGIDMASLGIGISAVFPMDLATDPVVRAFLQAVVKLG